MESLERNRGGKKKQHSEATPSETTPEDVDHTGRGGKKRRRQRLEGSFERTHGGRKKQHPAGVTDEDDTSAGTTLHRPDMNERAGGSRPTLNFPPRRNRRFRHALQTSVLEEDADGLRRHVRQLEEKLNVAERKALETARTKNTLDAKVRMDKEKRKQLEKQLAELKRQSEFEAKKSATTIQALTLRAEKAEKIQAAASNEGFFKDVLFNFKELIETNLQCSVCSEIFIFSATTSCGHTFCDECIEAWKDARRDAGRPNCPICRARISTTVANQVLDAYIDKAVDHFFSEEVKRCRQVLVAERRAKKQQRDQHRQANQQIFSDRNVTVMLGSVRPLRQLVIDSDSSDSDVSWSPRHAINDAENVRERDDDDDGDDDEEPSISSLSSSSSSSSSSTGSSNYASPSPLGSNNSHEFSPSAIFSGVGEESEWESNWSD